LNCINPIRDIVKIPLPPLEEIAVGVSIQLMEVVKHGHHSRRDLDVELMTTSTTTDWFPDNPLDSEQDLALDAHLGAEEAMSSRRVQDPEVAKTLVLSYITTTGATPTIIKRRFQITYYT